MKVLILIVTAVLVAQTDGYGAVGTIKKTDCKSIIQSNLKAPKSASLAVVKESEKAEPSKAESVK